MSTEETKSIKEVSAILRVSESYVYKLIRDKKLDIEIINNKKRVTKSSLDKLIETNYSDDNYISQREQNQSNQNDNTTQINQTNTDLLLNEYKNRIEELEKEINNLRDKNELLYKQIIEIEKKQKDDIVKVYNEQSASLKMFMELVKNTANNKIENNTDNKNDIEDDTIEVDIVDTNNTSNTDTPKTHKTIKTITKKQFYKLMKSKGYNKEKSKKIINKRLKMNDKRFFIDTKGKIQILKNKFSDL